MHISKSFNKRIGVSIFLFAFVISAFAQSDKFRIAFVGNSITAGVYGYGLVNEQVSYATQFSKLIKDYVNNLETFNAGVSGCTLTKNTTSSIWTQTKFNDAMNWAPDICLIALGTNDSKPSRLEVVKSDFYNDYMDMISQFKSHNSNVKIIVCLPPPIFDGHPYSANDPHNDNILVDYTIPLIDSIAKENNLMVVDFHTPFVDSIKYFDDRLHPNVAGHKKMAKILFNRFVDEGLIDIGSTAANHFVPKTDDQLRVFPNPTKNSCTVKIPTEITGDVAIRIFNSNGACIFLCNNIKEKYYSLDVADLKEGAYFIGIQSNNQIITHQLIVVK